MTNKRYEKIYNEDGFLLRQLSEHLSEEIKKYSSTLFIQLVLIRLVRKNVI